MRVKSRSAKDEIVGYDSEGVLVVKVSLPPVGGKANALLVELLAKALNVPRKSVRIARGAGSTQKVLHVPDSARFPLNWDIS